MIMDSYATAKLHKCGAKSKVLVLTGPPSGERHRRLGGCCRVAVPSARELSPCPLLRVAVLLPRVKGLGRSSLGLGESLLRARNATGEEVPSTCNTSRHSTALLVMAWRDLVVVYAYIYSFSKSAFFILCRPGQHEWSPGSSASCDTEL